MPIVLVLQMMEGWDRWGLVDLYLGVAWATGGGCHLIGLAFFLCFCILLSRVLSLFI